MALNAASHNAPGMKTGAVSGPPPPVSSEVTDDIISSSEKDTMGTNAPGQEEADKVEVDNKNNDADTTKSDKERMGDFPSEIVKDFN